jgi:CTP synthase (UTP-ammonia lyase)
MKGQERQMLRVGLIGDYDPQVKAHTVTLKAIALAAADLGCDVDIRWLQTPSLVKDAEQRLAECQVFWAVPNTPYASMEGALNGIRFAREHGVPLLGTCGGFQHMLIEYARAVLGLTDADHAESNPSATTLAVTPLACSVNDLSETFYLTPGSRVANIYGKAEIVEQYGICNYGLNVALRSEFEQHGLRVSGVDGNGEVRIVELEGHPFFIGTLFQPQRAAYKEIVHPLIRAWFQAAL